MTDPVEMLATLVGFDTTSSKSNLDLIHFVSDRLAEAGVEATVLPNADGSKANLFATIGPKQPGGICLSGHTDVVPVAGQPWDTDPFLLTDKDDGRLYGRGTCDMKAFPATALALLPEMLAKPLARPIHFAFSYDEEVGCRGAPEMIAEIGESLPKPSVVIIGEPTDMKVVSAHKGMWFFRTTVTGKEAHSSQMQSGVSAVMVASRLVAKLDEMVKERAAKGDFENGPGKGFTPPYTTIHVGQITGGTAPNIMARHAEFTCDVRNLPEDFPEDIQKEFEDWYTAEILPEMHAIDPATGIETVTENVVKGLSEDRESEAETFVRQITGDNDTHYVSYGTEAGQFQQAGMAAVVCGPGSIAQAHQPNEFIEKSQIAECEAFLRKVIARCRA
ncbi:acetylornithine deacetylase [Marivibrio halodurans]|uniref:Acetylornithine deacetylase n=1 Tax=Marivibrio halodurans TaxID=2039722 RepID=A0A8J7SQA1_9PROT|nr:acetylornithine deacetylase [Marivibrio halodurans]MBP5858921.1 acetylornithine deacetylase [Marivibrio halodurans]